TAKDFYYSAAWQLLEERLNGSANACAQYLWSPVYLDALILRDRDTDPDQPGLEERLYVQQDANWNVTAIANPAGPAPERYVYDPYGKATVYDAGWTVRGDGRGPASSYGWVYLRQGERFEIITSLYHSRYREYSPALGRWMQLDPIKYAAGDLNLYRYEKSNPLAFTDPLGLKGGHHWLPQAYKDDITRLCPNGKINQFKTPSVSVHCKKVGVGLQSNKNDIHGYLTHEWRYNEKFKEILDKSKTCCDLLIRLLDLMLEAAKALSKQFFNGSPVIFQMKSYSSPVDYAKEFMDMLEECYKKCRPGRRPVHVVVAEPVPKPNVPPHVIPDIPPIFFPNPEPRLLPKDTPKPPPAEPWPLLRILDKAAGFFFLLFPSQMDYLPPHM